MKTSYLLVGLLVITVLGGAQANQLPLKGKVITCCNPVPDATVTLSQCTDSPITVKTAGDGTFSVVIPNVCSTHANQNACKIDISKSGTSPATFYFPSGTAAGYDVGMDNPNPKAASYPVGLCAGWDNGDPNSCCGRDEGIAAWVYAYGVFAEGDHVGQHVNGCCPFRDDFEEHDLGTLVIGSVCQQQN
jgi:hypothetical protein